jgi:hypothetical protein
MPAKVNQKPLTSCRVTARYGDIVMVLLANVFEDKWFTWADLEYVLQVIDERMATQMQPGYNPTSNYSKHDLRC